MMTEVAPSGAVSKAAAGITTVFGTVSPTIATCTLLPGRSLSPGLGASTQTSTVVLFASTAGLTKAILPFTWPGCPGTVKGRIALVSPAVDANSTTDEVWVEAPNPGDKLRPGSSVQVAMVGETVPNTVVIPAAALLTAPDGATSVIMLDSQNAPQKKSVKTGIRDGQNVQVTEGLQGGERVVTVGAFELFNEDDPILAKTKIQV